MSLAEKLNNRKRVYKDKYKLGKPYIFVHPHKQNHVKKLVDNLPGWATYVIIFGSSVCTWHYWENDLDVCIVGNNPGIQEDDYAYRKLLKQRDCSYDFIEFADLDALLAAEMDINNIGYDIMREGVVVYEKS